MLSHACLTVLDAERPVSFLETIVSGLLRERWGQEGVLVTDGFSRCGLRQQGRHRRGRRSMPAST
jgi:beta-glucosidase-like glycosyl hydrolase